MRGKQSGFKYPLFLLYVCSFLATTTSSFAKDNHQNFTQAHLGETAYLVSQRELLLGLRQTSYGVLDYLSAETIPLYDLLGSWNLFAKLRVFQNELFALAARAGIFYITLEQLPEVQNKGLYRYFIGGTMSLRLADAWQNHFNLNNTSLHGAEVLVKNADLTMQDRIINIENDVEYRVDDRRTVLVGTGYDLSAKKFALGASHRWQWSSFYLKLGLTFKTTVARGMSMLPYFDLGVRI